MSLLQPQRRKYRKQQRGRVTGVATSGNTVEFGDFGMKVLSNCYITNRQLEAARKVIVRYVRKVGRVWIRMYPDIPYTAHGQEMPMGKGKGDVELYRIRAKRGKVLFEVSGIERNKAEEAFKQAAYKLPCKIRVSKKGEIR